MDVKTLAAAIEAILYVISDPLDRERLMEICPQADAESIDEAIALLNAKYSQESGGLWLREIAGGLQMSSRPEHDDLIREYLKIERRTQLSKQALETLAIIAYEQPITVPEIREIRGADPSGVIRTLLGRKLIRIAGRKEVIGKPFMYATSTDFLEYFGLNTLDDLPKPEEFVNLLDDGSGEFEPYELREREQSGLVRFEEEESEMPLDEMAAERFQTDETE